MDLRDYARMLRKRWLLILAFLLIGTGAGYGANKLAIPVYEAQTQLFGLHVSKRPESLARLSVV